MVPKKLCSIIERANAIINFFTHGIIGGEKIKNVESEN